MVINSIEQFLESIPSATGTEWSAISPYLNDANDEIISILTGKDLYEYIESLSSDNVLLVRLSRLIAYTAYRNAIPFVDLVQTANGFGIVSNANVKPASKERVDRLITMCEKIIDKTTDLLLTEVLATTAALDKWRLFSGFTELTECLFVTGIDFSQYCGQSELNRQNFINYRSDIMFWQNGIISGAINGALLSEIRQQIRTNTLTDDNRTVLIMCKQMLGRLVKGVKKEEAELALKNGVTKHIYENITKYPTVANADQEYEDAMAGKVRDTNKAEHPTFFFGI